MSVSEAPAGQPRGVELSIDWLEFSCKNRTVTGMRRLLVKHLGDQFDGESWTVQRDDKDRYDARGMGEARLQADRVGQLNRRGLREPWAAIRLPGAVCRAMGTPRLLALLRDAFARDGVKVSRVDLALDDYARSFTPRRFAKVCVAGALDDEHALLSERVVTRVGRNNWEWSRRVGGCFWLGGRKSERLLRVYDKEQESGGLVRSIRVELQLRDAWATEAAWELVEAQRAGQSLQLVACRHLVSFLDLREPTGSRTASHRWQRLGWWAKFVGAAERASLAVPEQGDALAWVASSARQCRGALQVLLQVAGVCTADDLARLRAGDAAVAAGVREVLERILGAEWLPLSREHRARLRELEKAKAAGVF